MMSGKTAFENLKSGLEQAISHAHGEITLETRTVSLPDPPRPMTPKQITALRKKKLHMSQGVFAKLINAAPQTVHAWEQGRSSPSGCALRFLRLLDQQPELAGQMLGIGRQRSA
ncbi:MAG: XRE family transcriptional regulator [Phycisphaerae bacterium]|nr:XRE family transcriptional regulator [Phycisphaerae bacterium]